MKSNKIDDISKELGLNAPRVTSSAIEDAIKNVFFINAGDALGHDTDSRLSCYTICIIELKNGTILDGSSAPVSNENFNRGMGEAIALSKAKDKIYPLLGFMLREKLHGTD